MCGFSGVVRGNANLEKSIELISHRGPDARGFYSDENVSLGFCRLKILDLSDRANQPFQYDNLVMVFNGEIYNHRELKKDLQEYDFQTHSDTEVLIYTFHKFGFREALRRIEGMFAIALYDRRERKLYLVRDRVGIKPLYYAFPGGKLAFSSEIKGLLPLLERREINPQAVLMHLAFLFNPLDETILRQVYKLQPGYFLEMDISSGRWKIEPYFAYIPDPDDSITMGAALKELEGIMESVVERQLISDVPVGIFLSGGVDSSLITYYASRFGNYRAYTLIYEREHVEKDIIEDESRYARDVASHLGVELIPVRVSFDEETISDVVWHLDEPLGDGAAISTYLICRQTDTTVMLSGMGGDEIFGGYPRYRAYELARRLRNLPLGLIYRILSAMGVRRGKMGLMVRNLEKFVRVKDKPYPYYLSYYDDGELENLVSGWDEGMFNPLTWAISLWENLPGDEYLRMLVFDYRSFLPHHNLLYSDKLSMAHSIELRVPLLDDRIIFFSLKLPAHLRRNKVLLKKLIEGKVPDHVIKRRKRGFGAPVMGWIHASENHVRRKIENLRRLDFMNYDEIKRIVDEEFAGRSFNYLRVFQFYTLAVWMERFGIL